MTDLNLPQHHLFDEQSRGGIPDRIRGLVRIVDLHASLVEVVDLPEAIRCLCVWFVGCGANGWSPHPRTSGCIAGIIAISLCPNDRYRLDGELGGEVEILSRHRRWSGNGYQRDGN